MEPSQKRQGLRTIAEAAIELAKQYCESGEELRAQIGASPEVRGNGKDERKRAKAYQVALSKLTAAIDSGQRPEATATVSPKHNDALRSGSLETMTQEYLARLLKAAKDGTLRVRDRVTRLPCEVKSPADEMLVSDDDLNAYLEDAGLAQLENSADLTVIVHRALTSAYRNELAATGKKLNRFALSKRAAEKLATDGVRNQRGGKPLSAETIRKAYMKGWTPPP